MKKLSAFIISAAMLFSLTACGNTSSDNSISNIYSNGAGQSSSSTSNVTSSAESSDTLNSTNSEQTTPAASESINTEQTSSDVPESSLTSSVESTSYVSEESSVSSTNNSTVEEKPSEPESSKILVAYFSATNITKGVAQKIASAVNADLYEITPQEPYTSDDLNYHSDSSRTSIEMNDPDVRPAISGSVENMDQYDIVFIGYPIWWGDAPRIMSTFVESYSFSDKTVVPFCTSGSSGVGSSASNLERQAGSGNWLNGTRLNGSASNSDISGWINGLGLNL